LNVYVVAKATTHKDSPYPTQAIIGMSCGTRMVSWLHHLEDAQAVEGDENEEIR